jgi:predicted nucleotide-binding protein
MSPAAHDRLRKLLDEFDSLPRADRDPVYEVIHDKYGAFSRPSQEVMTDPGFQGFDMAIIEDWAVRAEAALIAIFGPTDSRADRFQQLMNKGGWTSIARIETAQRLRAMIEGARKDLEDCVTSGERSRAPSALAAVGRKAFLVHGRDHGTMETVARFLERLGLQAVILHEQANRGQTLLEKFEANADVGFAVVLLTPDDSGYPADKPLEIKPRARQNVVFELGYFFSHLGRKRVCALHTPGIELPSDLDGVAYISLDKDWKLLLARELKAADIEVDLNLAM